MITERIKLVIFLYKKIISLTKLTSFSSITRRTLAFCFVVCVCFTKPRARAFMSNTRVFYANTRNVTKIKMKTLFTSQKKSNSVQPYVILLLAHKDLLFWSITASEMFDGPRQISQDSQKECEVIFPFVPHTILFVGCISESYSQQQWMPSKIQIFRCIFILLSV